jgi:hypothetical protein
MGHFGRLAWLLISICTASAAHVASAQDPGTGFEAGLRVGYAVPLGDAAGGDDDDNGLDRAIEGAVPIWIDLGYWVLPELFVGLYGQYGFGFVGDMFGNACDDNPEADCSAATMRLGLQLHYHPVPKSPANPWLGLGLGYEWLSFGGSEGDDEISVSVHGFELLNLQAGLDFKVTDNFYLGPALSFSLGQYSEISFDCSGANTCPDNPEIEEKAVHEWLMLAVRGAYAP